MNLEQKVHDLEDQNLKLKEELNKIQQDKKAAPSKAEQTENQELQLFSEKAIRNSDEKFRAVFEQAAVGIGIVGFEDAKWIEVNEAFCKMLGYNAEEFKSTPWPKITHPDDIDLDLIPFKKMAAGELNNYSVEKRFIHKKGHYVWARLTLSLVRDEKGKPAYEIAIIENITRRKKAEESLQRSEERWNLAIENFTEGAVIASEDEQVIYWNPAARKMHGFTKPDEGISSLEKNAEYFELWTIDNKHQLEVDEWPMRRIKRGEKVRNLELILRSIDHSWEKIVSYSGSMIKTAAGEKLIFLSIHDLTNQRKSEKALRKSEQLLQDILNVLPVGAFISDDKGNLVQTNPAAEKLWGGKKHVPLEDLDDYHGWWRDSGKKIHADEWAFARAFNKGETSVNEEIDIRCFDGTRKTILNFAAPVKDEKDQIISAVAISMDITDRIKTEEALRQSEEKFRAMADNISQLVWMADENGWRFWFNKRWYDFTGTTPEEVQGWEWKKVHHPKHVDRIITNIEDSCKTGEPWEDIFPLKGKNGQYRWFLTRAKPVKDRNGKIVRWFGSDTDVTEQRKSEVELKKSNELLENILYILAHDLKGPISNMQMAANLINSVEDISKKTQLLGMYEPQLERMDNTIKGVTGILQVQKTPESSAEKLNFETIIHDILAEFKYDLKPGELVWDFSKKRTVWYIEPFLLSILRNLVNNAIKYQRQDTDLRIEVTTRNSDGFTILSIRDNGTGIDLDKFGDQLFTPFMRIEPKKTKGTGIGLYIIKTIVEKNGGHIEVESTPGKGTAFHCYLKEYDG